MTGSPVFGFDVDRPVFGRAWRWKELGRFLPRIERGGGRESSCARGKERCGRHARNRYLLTTLDDASHTPTRDIPNTRMAVLILQAVPEMGEGKETLVACHPGHSPAPTLRRLRESRVCQTAAERSSPHGGATQLPHVVGGLRPSALLPPSARPRRENHGVTLGMKECCLLVSRLRITIASPQGSLAGATRGTQGMNLPS